MSNQLNATTSTSNTRQLVRETLRQSAVCRFILNYSDHRTKGRLFGFGTPKIGDPSMIKPYTSRLLIESIWPSRIVDGVVLYNYQLATCSPPSKYNTTFTKQNLELVFGCLGLRPRFDGLKGLKNQEIPSISYFFPEVEDLLMKGRQMPLELPRFSYEIGGFERSMEIGDGKLVTLDTVNVQLPNNGDWMVCNRGEPQKPECGIYGTFPLSKLQYDNQKARELNPEVPLLLPYERPEAKHRNGAPQSAPETIEAPVAVEEASQTPEAEEKPKKRTKKATLAE